MSKAFGRRAIIPWLLAGALLTYAAAATADRLADVKRQVRETFPGVSQLSTPELQALLSANGGTELVLLDTRETEEFDVSHLQGARLAPSLQEALQRLEGTPKDRLVVTYCSVGYRSSALADKLTEHGYTNVRNLEGSIFEWANRGLPVYRGEKEVRAVHPYNLWWGRLLNKNLRVW